MEVLQEKNETKLVLCVNGRLDSTTAPQLEEVVNSSLNGIVDLVLDLKGLEYISSAGLRVLLQAQKIMNAQGKMSLKNVNEIVMEVLEITGFADILTIEK